MFDKVRPHRPEPARPLRAVGHARRGALAGSSTCWSKSCGDPMAAGRSPDPTTSPASTPRSAAKPWNDMRFFNPRKGDKAGAAETAEGWQILSPVRSAAHGVPDLNRLIHKQFRQPMIDASRKEGWQRKFPKPMGSRGDRLRRQGHQPRQHEPGAAVEQASQGLPGEGRRLHRQRRDRHGGRLLLEEGSAGPPLEARGRVLLAARVQVRLHQPGLRRGRQRGPRTRLCADGPQVPGQRVRHGHPRAPESLPAAFARVALHRAHAPEGPRRHPPPGPAHRAAQVLLGRPLRDRAPPDQPLRRAVARSRSTAASSRSTSSIARRAARWCARSPR